MSFIRNMKISRAILIIMIIPLLAAMIFAGQLISQNANVVRELDALGRLTNLSVKMSNLVHEQQKERGATAVFLGSHGQKFRPELAAQRQNTNEKRSIFLDFVKGVNTDAYGEEFQSRFAAVLTELQRLDSLRAEVDSFSIALPDAIAYFTRLNKMNLDAVSLMALISRNADVSNHIQAYVNFLQSKERAGIERAVGAGAFAKGFFSNDVLNKFKGLVFTQDVYIDVFLSIATENQKSFFRNTVQGPAVDEVLRMRQVAIENPADTSAVDAPYWFKMITDKINLLKVVENKLADDLLKISVSLRDKALQQEIRDVVMALLSLLVTLGLSVLILKALSGGIRAIVRSTTDLAEGNLRVTLPERTGNELGEIVEALKVFQQNGIKAEENRNLQEAEQESKQRRAERLESLVLGFEEKASHAVSTVATAANQLYQTADVMGAQVSSAHQKSSEVSEAAGQTSNNVLSVASAVEEMSASVKEISQQMQNANRSVKDSSEKANTAGQSAEKLQQASESIGQIAQMIEHIAGQINLLALNATIESARAGEAGKGFAVVASEVKNLASQTAKATEQIAKEIVGVQDVASSVVAVLGAVKESINSVTESSNAVASAVEEQTAVTNEISANMHKASSGVEHITGNISDIANATHLADEATKQVQSAARTLSEQAEDLSREVQEFLQSIRSI